MAVDVRPPAPEPLTDVSHDERLIDLRVRPRSFHRDDVLVLLGAAVAALALVWVVYEGLTLHASIAGLVIWWYFTFLVLYWLAVRHLHGKLSAGSSLMTVVIASLALAMLVPLLLIIGFVLYQGVSVLSPHFFVATNQFCATLSPVSCGGVGHAIVGTAEEVGIAMVIAVPLAVLCAVFLNEIGGRLKRPVRLFVDAMSGVPSIVAGLFIYAVWVVDLHRGFSGFGASLALAILMLPTVTRTSEEVLRLVPDGLREGSLALGASEWRTVWGVVLPTARSGLISAVILGVARTVGETAPLIMTSFGASVINANPFVGSQEALPHYVYEGIRNSNPGTGPYVRAWGGAVVLIFLVLALFTLARVLGSITSVESRQRRASKRAARMRPVMAQGEGAGS